VSEGSQNAVQPRIQERAPVDVHEAMRFPLMKPDVEPPAGDDLELGATAILPGAGGSRRRGDGDLVELPDPDEQLLQDLPLPVKLRRILQVLPLASPAVGKVGTRRRGTEGGGSEHPNEVRPDEIVSGLRHRDLCQISRSGERDEDDPSVRQASQTTALEH